MTYRLFDVNVAKQRRVAAAFPIVRRTFHLMSQETQQVARYYDAEADVYDRSRYCSTAGQRSDRFHRNVLDSLFGSELRPGSWVLDVGCGTGRLLEHMATKHVVTTGVDFSERMLSKAKQRALKQPVSSIALVRADAMQLSFPSHSFDAVYSVLVLNLIPEYRRALREIRRVLKPEKPFVFNVPYLGGFWGMGGWYVNYRKATMTSNSVGRRYSHWFTKRELNDALSSTGFALEAICGMPFYVSYINDANPLSNQLFKLLFAKSIFIKARSN